MKKMLLFLLVLIIPNITKAHVGYIVGEEVMEKHVGKDLSFLLTPFSNIEYIGLMLLFVVLVFIGYFVLTKTLWGKKWSERINEKLTSYHELIPWIIRLSLGIALIGAGTEQVLISPLLKDISLGSLQIVLGFMFMAGFLLVPATLTSIVLYFIALSKNIYILGNLDFLVLLLGFLVFHSARPGIDDVLNISILKKIKIHRLFLAPLLRFGIGIGMIYLALYEKLLNPHFMELVVHESNLASVIPVSPEMWVLSTGIIELAVGLCLLIGYKTRAVSVIAILVLSLSFFYFKEAVYSHITLFGTLSILTIESSGVFSIDALRKKRESQKLQNKIFKQSITQ